MHIGQQQPGSPTFTATAQSPIMTNSVFILLSLLLTLHNKYVLDEIFVRSSLYSSNVLLTCQNAFSVAVLLLLRRLGKIEFPALPPFGSSSRMLGMTAVSQALQVVCGLGALSYINIVVHGVLKRCTCVASWVIEFFFERQRSTLLVIPAILVMIAGSVVAGTGDLHFSAIGYTLAIASCVFQGAMFELGRKFIKKQQQQQQLQQAHHEFGSKESAVGDAAVNIDEKSTSGYALVLYCNSVATGVVALLLALASVSDHIKSHSHSQHATHSGDGDNGGGSGSALAYLLPLQSTSSASAAAFHVLLNALLSTAMNASIFVNCVTSSALSHAISGNIKAALQTIVGAVMFDNGIAALGWVGVGGNIVGAALFSVVRYKYK